MVGAIAIVSEPTSVHVAPSGEIDAAMVEPVRVSLTKYGAVPAPPDVLVDSPSVSTRRWNASPLPGLTRRKAWGERGVSASRIITPAFVQLATYCSLATRVTSVPSPVSVV